MFSILFLFLFVTLICSGIKFTAPAINANYYTSRERTTLINGFFIWIVFFSHMSGYRYELPAGTSFLLKHTVGYFGQCVVATFFFFSGYGIMHSLQKKGTAYASDLIKKRFFLLLLHFALAVLVFVGVQYCLGKSYTFTEVALSLIGWDSIGNSNWFIFITLVSYIFISLSYLFSHKLKQALLPPTVTLLFCILIQTIHFKGGYWVDTCLCIPAGMFFCIWRPKVDVFLNQLPFPSCLIGLTLFLLGTCTYRYAGAFTKIINFPGIITYYVQNGGAIIFAIGILLLFANITLKRRPNFLCWSGGEALFSLYIFQRIPMLLGKHWGLHTYAPFLYEMFCIAATLLIAYAGSKVFTSIDKTLVALFPRKKA